MTFANRACHVSSRMCSLAPGPPHSLLFHVAFPLLHMVKVRAGMISAAGKGFLRSRRVSDHRGCRAYNGEL
jgi:hypothetical protein